MRNASVLGLMALVAGSAAGQDLKMIEAPLQVAQAARPQQARSGIVRCEVGGRTLYQAAPCEDPATESEVSGGSFTVVDPHPVSPRAATGKPAESTRRAGAGAEDTEAAALKKKADCNRHQRSIDRIDSQARVRSTARLAEQRRGHKDSMWKLGCGFP